MKIKTWQLFLAFCLAPCNSLASDFDCNGKQINAGLYEHGFLYNESDQGIDKDIITELSKRTDCKISFVRMPRARIWHEIDKGMIDLTMSGIITEERARYAWFIPYMQMKVKTIFKNQTHQKMKTVDSFTNEKDFKLGVVRSYRYGDKYDKIIDTLNKSGRIETYPDNITLFKALRSGRVHAVLSQSPAYLYTPYKLNFTSKIKIIDWHPDDPPIKHSIVLSKKNFSLDDAKNIMKIIQKIYADGLMIDIIKKHMGDNESKNIIIPPEEVKLLN
jgi:polar amino acid transport system substrate-binding protein